MYRVLPYLLESTAMFREDNLCSQTASVEFATRFGMLPPQRA